jgi:hypothetical protein
MESGVAARKLAAFNELQHTIGAQVAKMLVNDEARYPDAVLIDILLDKARDGDIESEFARSYESALKHAASSCC